MNNQSGRQAKGGKQESDIRDFKSLHRKAQAPPEKQTDRLNGLFGQDKEQIIHESGMYQFELEKQNEDLRRVVSDLKASQRRYADLYDFAPVGYFSLDLKGEIDSVNITGASMLGWVREEMIHKALSGFVHHEDRDALNLYIRKTVREKGRQVFELRMQRKDKTHFYSCLDSIPIRNEAGKVVEIRTIVTDITGKKEKEMEIRELNRELLRSNEDLLHFVFIVSHDLQEPLRTVSSFVQLIERRYQDKLDEKGLTFMQHIVEGTGHMQNLLNDLLTYSRVGGGLLAREPVSLDKVLDGTRRNLAETIRESRAKITSSDLPVVQGDEILFSTLLQNLIGNSLKYRGKDPPRIHISAQQRENNWIVCVQDNGIGIDPRYVEQIFLIFQRLHRRNEYEGTGIGLAICKKIVERHGGRIWVESEPDRGAKFCFSLPVEEVCSYA